jgi:hypothetical protein
MAITSEKVVQATGRDIPLIIKLLVDMYHEAGMGKLVLDKVEKTVKLCLEKGAIILIEKDNKVIGLMGLRITELWWCYDHVFMDQFTYVAPEGRKTRAIFKLVKFADGLAKQAGIPLMIANFGTVDTERKSKLYKRFGLNLGNTILLGDTKEFLWN